MKTVVSILFLLLLFSCADRQVADNNDAAVAADTVAVQEPDTTDCHHEDLSRLVSRAYLLATLNSIEPEDAEEWLMMEETGTLPQTGLLHFEVDTVYNKNCILEIRYEADWMGAYASYLAGYLNFNKRTGDTLRTTEFIQADRIDELVALCNRKLQQKLTAHRKELVPGDGLEDFDEKIEMDRPVFTVEHLQGFRLTDKAIVFQYDFGFPHAMIGIEPDEDITVSAEELKPFLLKDGMFWFWVQ